MLRSARLKCEMWLYRLGFSSDAVRRPLSRQIVLSACLVPPGLVALPFSTWPAVFALGSILATVNFILLSRSVDRTMRMAASGAVSAGMGSYFFRLGLMAAAITICLVWLRTPVIPLVAGLSTVMAGNAAAALARIHRHTHKEA